MDKVIRKRYESASASIFVEHWYRGATIEEAANLAGIQNL